jgi:hypothetical protein
MQKMNYEAYLSAINEWDNTVSNFAEIERLIPLPYVFELSAEQIEKLNEEDEYPKNFRLDMGILKDQVVLILVQRDSKGELKKNDYSYSVLGSLESDIELKEVKQYTLVNRSILSKDLTKTSTDSDMSFPILSQPAAEQQVAVKEIEDWRESGMEWFQREDQDFEGKRIFRRFFISKEDLLHDQSSTTNIICSFALKFSDIYQRVLVSLVFISFQKNLLGSEISSDFSISNTYNYARPCPPVC